MNAPTIQSRSAGRAQDRAGNQGSRPDAAGSAIAQTSNLISTDFVWGAGIECSFLPHLGIDQYEWTQHNRFWKDDLRRAREELGVTHLRYAFPWHQIETQRGQCDWSMVDERLEHFENLKLEPVLDVMHFGTPVWLRQAVGDPEFPEALENFASQMVTRYRGRVKTWCPFNEPLVSALFSGDFGFWPPHARKWRGYMPVLSRIITAVSRAIRTLRRDDPHATVLLCDTVENYKTRVDALQVEVRRRNLRRFLAMDLLTGRVDKDHPLYNWLMAYGMSEIDLEWFKSNPQRPDVMGLDYYSHSDWQLDQINGAVRQRRAEAPVGLYGIGTAYYQRYGIPMMLTETSIEGQALNREIWLESTVEDCRRLREEGIPLLGYFWWPLVDQLDWDGALTHRVGKIHQVGLFNLTRQADGTLSRAASPLVKQFAEIIRGGNKHVGELTFLTEPTETAADQGPPIGVEPVASSTTGAALVEVPSSRTNGNGHGNGNGKALSPVIKSIESADDAPGLAAEPAASRLALDSASSPDIQVRDRKDTGKFGIVVFSHLRWGFVWQRPQQFLSRFAKKHKILFVEEPFFDVKDGQEAYVAMHKVMPNVSVAAPHMPASMNKHPSLPETLRKLVHEAIEGVNDAGEFDRPLLWYYSPMDSSWSLGHFENRGIVYDSMDELSQFSGAPRALVDNEARLMKYADIVFAGGYELSLKKKQKHNNVHFFGCGVEFEHFNKAQDPNTVVPPDIDFMGRPILGWFGVVDERVDYQLVGHIARERPDWSIAMVGPVVKVDPNLLPHAPNLFWLGGRDYQQLPNYARAFDVCMMSFAINAATEYINPTKALEYLATGKPVISTPVKDVVRQWSDLVDIAKAGDDFIKAAERALINPDRERIARGLEKARSCSWENTVKSMQSLIADAIKPEQRPSRAKIEPLNDVEIAYAYAATQGS